MNFCFRCDADHLPSRGAASNDNQRRRRHQLRPRPLALLDLPDVQVRHVQPHFEIASAIKKIFS